MARVQHNCTGCIPIDASIIEVYIQLLGAKASANSAAERAEYAAEHAIGKSPYIGANGDWWEWDDERGEFIDTMVQAQGSIAVDTQLDPNSTNPVQNKVTTQALAGKQDTLVSGENVKTVGGQSIIGPGDIPVGDENAVKFVSQDLTDQQKTQARTNIGAYQKPGSGIPKADLDSSVQTSLGKADTAIQDISGKQDVISDLSTIRSGAAAGATAYQKPGTGVPKTDLASAVQTSLGKADTAYQKPSGGVPKSDLASSVQTSLSKADTAIQPAEFNELEEEVGTIGNGAYEEAWDGSSAPVVADIPAGVSVTYNSTSYTGTLAASASTVDKIYLVSDGNGNYDRYTTVEANGAYSWKKVGSTAIPLSNYATKTQVNQLEHKVDEKADIAPGTNLFDKDADGITTGKYLYSSGSEIANASYNISDYIPVEEQTVYHISAEQNGSIASAGAYFCFYDADKTFISAITGNNISFTTPQDCAYFRFSYDVSKVDIILNKGTVRPIYENYSPIGAYNKDINEAISRVVASSIFGNKEITLFRYINTSGVITIAGSEEYATAKFEIKKAGDYIVSIGPGTSSTIALVKYTDNTYSTVDSIIVGKNESGYIDKLTLAVGYYAMCWRTDLSKQNNFVTNESVLTALWADLNYRNGLLNNVYDKRKDILYYTYIDNSGLIATAGANYHTIKFQITTDGNYYIKSGSNAGRPILVKYTDNTYSTVSSILSTDSGIDKVVNLSTGYYAICHDTAYTEDVILTNVGVIFKAIQWLNFDDDINTKTVVRNLFGINNVLEYTRILDTGAFQTVAANYKTYKIHIEKTGWYFIQSGQNSYSYPELCKYTDETYGTLSAKIIDDKSAGVPARITGLYYLESGYYALCHNDQFTEDTIFTKYKGVISFLNESAKALFNTIDNGYPGVIVRGTSARTTGGINLKSGYSNRISLDAGFVCAHYTMAFKFVSTNDVALVVGYSIDNYATLSNHFKVVGGTTNKFYYYASANDANPVEHAIGFALNTNEEYLFVLTWNNDTGKYTLELYGQFNEYANWEVAGDPGPIPMFYSETDDTLVESFQLSPQCYYDLKNAKLGVFGHSFVQASTMRGSGLQYSFVGLLASALGEDKVLNFGLGGENYYNALSKLNNELLFVKNTEYALAYLGVNDVFGGITGEQLIQRAENFVARFKKQYNIVPILFTCQPSAPENTLAGAYSGVQQAALDYNAWLRSSGYLYVDAEQVFVDVNVKTTTPTNSNIKTGLFLADGVHPNADGHRAIFNRIKMDCPFLF